MRSLKVTDCGVIEYGRAWDMQKQIFNSLIEKSSSQNVLLYCEHPHVYTLGKSGQSDNLLVSDEFLRSIDACYFKTDRGGDITYHGYGQLVGYPIINISDYNIGLREYIDIVEKSVIGTISKFGIEGFRIDGATGVWVNENGMDKKICALGVKASRYITMHGFALNVNTDLTYFNYINPCGFTEKGVTSISEICKMRGASKLDDLCVSGEMSRECREAISSDFKVELSCVKDLFTKEFNALLEGKIK